MKRLVPLLALAGLMAIALPCVAVTPAENVPALKVTAPNGKTSVLLGSLHVPYPGLWQPAQSLLQGRTRLVIEGSRTQGPQPPGQTADELFPPAAMSKVFRGETPDRAPWAKGLSDANIASLRHAGSCMKPPVKEATIDIMLAMKSARLAATVAYVRCEYPGQQSRDEIMASAAEQFHVPVDTLETQVAAEAQRSAVSEHIYVDLFRKAFEPRTERAYAETVAALNRGDYAALLDGILRVHANRADADTFYRLMIGERNRAWMQPLQRYLDEGNAIVLVGASHLPGDEGLLRLLNQAGYATEPILLPAADNG